MDASGLNGISATTANAASTAAATAPKAPASTGTSGTTSSASTNTPYYSSPVVTYDSATHAVILQWRDSHTGTPLFQSPSQAALLYAEAQKQGGSSPPQSSPGNTANNGAAETASRLA